MNLIIAGCRDFNDRDFIYEKIDSFIEMYGAPERIIEGGATGADRIAGEYAREHDIHLTVFNADWKTYGRAAGPIRNEHMAEYGTHLLAFWDCKSRGTANMIESATKRGLEITIIKIVA